MHDFSHRPYLWLAGILLLAFGVRAAAAVWWQARLADDFYFGDSQSYWVLARAIARGADYQFGSPDARIFRTPGYPLALAPLFLIFGDQPPMMAARLHGASLGTGAVAAVYWLARLLWNSRVALAAALAAALYPGAIATSIFVLSEALFTPLLLVELALLVVAGRAATAPSAAAWGLAMGAVAGVATLVRPSWLFFTPLAAAAFVFVARPRRRHALLALATTIGLVAVMCPWWIRNYRVSGHFVPTTLQVGASLYDGLNPRATGASDMAFVEQIEADERSNPPKAGADIFEYRLDRRLRQTAINWARTHPFDVIGLAKAKIWRLWNIWPNEPAFRTPPMRLAVFATFVPIVILALFATWRFRSLGWPLLLLWMPAAYVTVLHAVFVSSLRYREPVMLPLMVLAAAQIFAGWLPGESPRIDHGRNSATP